VGKTLGARLQRSWRLVPLRRQPVEMLFDLPLNRGIASGRARVRSMGGVVLRGLLGAENSVRLAIHLPSKGIMARGVPDIA
jgi:hypothetical protein